MFSFRKFVSTNRTSKMKTLKKIVSFAIIGFPLILQAQSAPTLQELIDAAMTKDAAIEQQNLDSKSNLLDQQKLKDVFLPKLEISGKTGYINATARLISPEITIPAIKPIFPGAVFQEGAFNNNFTLSGFEAAAKAEAKVLIYSGGKVKYLKQALVEKNNASQALQAKNQDEVITQISKAYDQFALVAESKKVLDESKRRLDANKKTAEKALGYGLITPYDYKKIELAQATLDSKMVEYEGKRELLITQLNVLTGIGKERIELINPNLEKIEYFVDKTIENRAELKALDFGMKAIDAKIKAEKTWWIPKVQASTSLSYLGFYNTNLSSSKALIPGSGTKLDYDLTNLNLFPIFQAGIGFKWDIFDGNEGKHEIEKAKIEKEILESKKSDTERKLQLNLANNQTNYNIADSQIEMKAKARQIAKNALIQAEKEFRYGLIKSSQLIEAENDLETAELDYQTAIFNQRRAAVELMKSTQNLSVDKL
ncbi:Outer membrane protein TolC [Epilithonimonas mollis]|uniref:Outer membrane protein TolC n=2 Tax=Epilithonimonas mollis TaxID=216903 RepID=A0A1M6TB41_9FLAO|nr:Outer membrane protein TolC [Epilithonimonas mollis]